MAFQIFSASGFWSAQKPYTFFPAIDLSIDKARANRLFITFKVIFLEVNAVVITRATEYAIRAVLFMASHPRGEIVLKKDICREQEITPAFLTKILQPLIKQGIVGSHRGVGGGFYLVKDPADISLLDVIKAEEGPLYLNLCLAQDYDCSREPYCPVNQVWQEARNDLLATLQRYDFAQLCHMEERNLRLVNRSAGTGGGTWPES